LYFIFLVFFIMCGCKCESSIIALTVFGVFFSVLLIVSILSSIYFSPEPQAIDYVSIKGSGQYLVNLDGGFWSGDAVISSDASLRNITAYRFSDRPTVDSKSLTYSSENWNSEVYTDTLDSWSFFLVEDSKIQWNVTTNVTANTSFYIFASADDYYGFLSNKPVNPLVSANGTSFQGNLSIKTYNHYYFVAKAAANLKLDWQIDFWKASFTHDKAHQSCDIIHGICSLKTNPIDYILVEVNQTFQNEAKVAIMVPVHAKTYWLFVGALILSSTITIPVLFSMLILH